MKDDVTVVVVVKTLCEHRGHAWASDPEIESRFGSLRSECLRCGRKRHIEGGTQSVSPTGEERNDSRW